MILRLARTLFACLLGIMLAGTQTMAAVSSTCQPTTKHSCGCPGQAAPGCRMGCEDQHTPEAISTAGTARTLAVPIPDAVAAAWHEDAAPSEDANTMLLARCLFHPPTLKRYLLNRTLRL